MAAGNFTFCPHSGLHRGLVNPYPAEYIKMPRPLLIFSQSEYLIGIVAINLHTSWQTVQIQISWLLLQKPSDLDLHCLQRQDISGFSRTRVKKEYHKNSNHRLGIYLHLYLS